MRINGDEVDDLVQQLSAKLRQKQILLATAESCTGGELGALITEAPGASRVYAGGVVTYADQLKTKLLGVDARLLAEHGAVSAQVAEAMAVGVVRLTDAQVGVSLTGIAGPDGGTIEKPVGTVWCGLANRNGRVTSHLLQLTGERAAIRLAATKHALVLLNEFLA